MGHMGDCEFLAANCLFIFLYFLETSGVEESRFYYRHYLFDSCCNGKCFASKQKEELLNRDTAIIMSPSVTVRSTPSENGTSLFILHEGHKVNIKDDSMKDWKEIRLEDGKVGWVPVGSIEII